MAVVAWLAYTAGRMISLSEIARLHRDQELNSFSISAMGGLGAVFERSGGAARPLLRAPDGVPLFDFSNWDPQSAVIVDGVRHDLMRLYPSHAIDFGRHRLVETLTGPYWQLLKEIELHGSRARVRFLFVPRRPVTTVQLAVAHSAASYFLDLTRRRDGLTAAIPLQDRGQLEGGIQPTLVHHVEIELVTPVHPSLSEAIVVSAAGTVGVATVIATFVYDAPAVDRYNVIGEEHISWRPLL